MFFPLETEHASSVELAAEEQRILALFQAFKEIIYESKIMDMFQCQHWVCVFKNAIETSIKKSAKHIPRMLFYSIEESIGAIVLNKNFTLIY